MIKEQDMETIKTWKIFILIHSILFWHKPFFWPMRKFGPTPVLWTHVTHAIFLPHAKTLWTHASHAIFLTYANILWTHATHAKILQTHATHSKVWPTSLMHPRTHVTHAI